MLGLGGWRLLVVRAGELLGAAERAEDVAEGFRASLLLHGILGGRERREDLIIEAGIRTVCAQVRV